MTPEEISDALEEMESILSRHDPKNWQAAPLEFGYEALTFFTRFQDSFPAQFNQIATRIEETTRSGGRDGYNLFVHSHAALTAAHRSLKQRALVPSYKLDLGRVQRDFRRRQELMMSATVTQFPDRVSDFLSFVKKEPSFTLALGRLASVSDTDVMNEFHIARNEQRQPSFSDYVPLMRMALHLMETGLTKVAFEDLCMEFRIRPSYSTNNVQDMINAFKNQYVEPLVKYFEDALHDREEEYTLNLAAKEIAIDIVPSLVAISQELAEEYSRIERTLGEARESAEFQNVARMCRDFLIHLAKAVYKPEYLQLEEEPPKDDAAKLKLEITLRACRREGAGDRLTRVAKATWDIVAEQVHDTNLDSSEARGTFAQTGLCTYQIITLLQQAGILKQ